MKKKKSQMKSNQANEVTNCAVVNAIVNQPPSKSDPNGSYTGKPLNKNEKPVQDADDL